MTEAMASSPVGEINTTSSLLQSLLSTASSTLSESPTTQCNGSFSATSMGAISQTVLDMARLVPAILFWLITFTTITLPTVLFTLFSTSLTFTMNATTLYAAPDSVLCDPTDSLQTPDRVGIRLDHLMDRQIPLSQHVCPTTARASAQRAPDRPLPGYARRLLETGAGELPRRVPERNQGVWISYVCVVVLPIKTMHSHLEQSSALSFTN